MQYSDVPREGTPVGRHIPIYAASARGCSWKERKHIHADRLSNVCTKTLRKEDGILYQCPASRFRNCLLVLGIRHSARIAIGGYPRCVQALSAEIDNSRGSWEGRGLHTNNPACFWSVQPDQGTVLPCTWLCTTRHPRRAALRYT